MSIRRSCLALLLACPIAAHSQGQLPFTASDALDIASFAVLDLTNDGRWIAATSSTRRSTLGTDYRRDGDPSYIRPSRSTVWVIDAQNGERRQVFPDAKNIRAAAWSPDATQLGLLVLVDSAYVPMIWNRATGAARTLPVPPGQYVAENSDLRWTADGRRVVVSLRTIQWKARVAAEFARMTRGPVFVQDGKDPFLAWDALRRLGNVRSVAAIEVASGRSAELLPEGNISAFTISADDSVLAYQEDITPRTDYDVIFGTENRLMLRQLGNTAAATIVHPTLRGMTLAWADDGRRYAYARDGRVFVARLGDGSPRQVAGPDSAPGTAADTSAAARQARANARFAVARWSPRGDALLLTNPQGYWIADATSGQRELLLATDTLPGAPRYAPVAWSPDGRHVYFSHASRTQWERGLLRVDRTTRQREDLARDRRLYQGFRLSKDGTRFVYTSGEGNRPGELYTADASLRSPRALTHANPQLANKALARTELITYRDTDGRTRYGVAYLPAGFTPGTPAPTLFNIYEDFFDDTFDATVNVFTSAGYVVVKPSVAFETGFPGEAWLKGVTAAANALVERGVADSARLGVFGTSYGGYATNLLITQTPRFKAAVNVSGKVDMISFYTDSPRLGVRNIHAAEKSQDRLGATLWQQPQKYVAHSAIMFADRITTPLMLVTGEQDSNVPADNSREMYFALRRLGKDVTWVNYMNSGHGTPGTNAAEFIDYHERLLGFFDGHLKPAPAAVVEATSLTGEPLYRNTPTGAAATRMAEQLADARRAWRMTPDNADSLIWYGRRTAYPGR
ncbi:MAG: S9 family peptidase, partial [Gemmatimonadetes bacterium]|nr:S9 family peptidase [Gemmatimonadota bacterium]